MIAMASLTFSSDRPSDTDALGRADFARSLAYALLSVSGQDGLVVGIEGDWGSGKSTVLGFVRKCLSDITESGASPIIVEFNPWLISSTGALVEALITQIASALCVNSASVEKGVEAGEKLIGYVSLLKHLKHLKYFKYAPGLGWIGHLAEDGAGLVDSANAAVESADSMLKELRSTLPKLDINRKKMEVLDALTDVGRPIIVFVDDLDRLPAEEIKALVQTIKAVADFPRTTYVLAYDRAVVAHALGNGDDTKGLSYLEKIVQVAYPIPPLFQFQMTQFVDKTIGDLLISMSVPVRDYESSRYPSAIKLAASLMRQPRDVVRLANRLILSIPATRNEVNICDVLVFEAISLRFPSIRERVHRHPSDYVGMPFDVDVAEYTDTDWAAWAYDRRSSAKDDPSWEKGLPPDEGEHAKVKKALKFIFGKYDQNRGTPDDELRMLSSNRLARYFRMTSLDSVPEVASIHALLRDSERLQQALDAEDLQGLEATLEWTYAYIPSCSGIDSPQILIVLALFSASVVENSSWNAQLARVFSKVLSRILRYTANDVRAAALIQIVELAPLSVAVNVLLDAVAEQGKWVMGATLERATGDQLVSDFDAVDQAVSRWSERVRKKIGDGSLVKESNMHEILYRLGDFNRSYGEVFQAVREICSTDDGLKEFLSVFIKNSPFNDLQMFGLVDDAVALVTRINESILSQEYGWLVSLISNDDWVRMIAEQAHARKNIGQAIARQMTP
jgi:hypothetical protein